MQRSCELQDVVKPHQGTESIEKRANPESIQMNLSWLLVIIGGEMTCICRHQVLIHLMEQCGFESVENARWSETFWLRFAGPYEQCQLRHPFRWRAARGRHRLCCAEGIYCALDLVEHWATVGSHIQGTIGWTPHSVPMVSIVFFRDSWGLSKEV